MMSLVITPFHTYNITNVANLGYLVKVGVRYLAVMVKVRGKG